MKLSLMMKKSTREYNVDTVMCFNYLGDNSKPSTQSKNSL